MKFKLIQWNIWHGTYLEEVVAFLQSQKPDVVCLQEVGTRGRALQASEDNLFESLKQRLRYQGEHAKTFGVKEKSGLWQMGVAVLSRWSVKVEEIIPYGGGYKEFAEGEAFHYAWPSSLLIARVEGLPFPVATTHLPVTKKTAVTERQLKAAREVQEALDPHDSLILAGDMNTLPQSKTYQVVSKGLEDVTDPSVPTLHPATHKVGHLGYHVDYVFYRGERIHPLRSEIPVVNGSDHLPVVVEFEVEK